MDDKTQAPPPEVDHEAEEDTVLDLTSCQLHDLDSVELPQSLTELDLTANRLSSLDPRIATLSNLKKLSFRQNLIADDAVEPISRWDTLSALEVFIFINCGCGSVILLEVCLVAWEKIGKLYALTFTVFLDINACMCVVFLVLCLERKRLVEYFEA